MSRRDRDESGVVVPSRVMLVAIVVVAIAAVMYVATAPGKNSASANPTGSDQATNSAKPTASVSSPTATKTSSTPSPTATPTPTPTVDRGKTFVAVFNNSGRTGLAASTATKATAKGWKVVGTDNWYGSVPSTTVYYPTGKKPAAALLAKDLGIARVMPSVAPMRADRLTVILTDSYRG